MKDGSNLPAPKGVKKPAPKAGSLAFLNKSKHSRLFNNATTRSMPSSPSLAATRSPLPHTAAPTSVPTSTPTIDEKARKMQALRTPLLHLLAVRPVSEKFLAQTTGSSKEECLALLDKVGKPARLDPSKWDLSDRTFKELDIWKFNYGSEDDRQSAIDRAISAFDRMRLSREDKLWQKLLPNEERGKGKILSKLQLHTGPRGNTPRIQVEATNGNVEDHNGGDSDDDNRKRRLVPSDAERSRSQDPIKKRKVSEKEAQSKRLLSKNPRKAQQTTSAKTTTTTNTKEAKKIKPAVKKGEKKAVITAKSTEFVHDSDEEEDINAFSPSNKPTVFENTGRPGQKAPKKTDAVASPQPRGLASKASGAKANTKNKKTLTNAQAKRAVEKPVSSSTASSSTSHSRSSSQTSVPMQKTLSRQRTTSSPHKPSPLGSSPPTNASDLEHDGKVQHVATSSSAPVVAQAGKANGNPVPRLGVAKPVSKPVQHTSEHTLKRKADDIDLGIHNHHISLTNGNVNGVKRQRPSPPTPPSSASDPSPQPISELLVKAQRFKQYYADYEKLYREVAHMPNPPQPQVDLVLKKHQRLIELKAEIGEAAVTL